VSHLIGNRASFLCTKAPMLRIPETNFLQGITSISGRDAQAIFCRRRHQHGFNRVHSSTIRRVHFLDDRWLWPRKAGRCDPRIAAWLPFAWLYCCTSVPCPPTVPAVLEIADAFKAFSLECARDITAKRRQR
jgi:hypothetical protein